MKSICINTLILVLVGRIFLIKTDISREVIYIPHYIFDTEYDYLDIHDVTNPILAEKQCILAVRSDNPCFDSFAAEIVYHALAVGWYEGIFDYGYQSAIKADLGPGDRHNSLLHSEESYKANDGDFVVFMS